MSKQANKQNPYTIAMLFDKCCTTTAENAIGVT